MVRPSWSRRVLGNSPGLTGSLLAILATLALPAAGCELPVTSHEGADAASASLEPHGVGGPAADASRAGEASLPSERDQELARMQAHLDSLYSQSDVVHRFTTAGGDGVDCLPFEKQPGFSRVGSVAGSAPVLDAPGRADSPSSEASFGEGADADGHARSCPLGAVPIHRVTLVDLARFVTLEDSLRKEPLHVREVTDNLAWAHDHAGHQQLATPNWGAQTTLNVWDPAVDGDSFSLSQLWVFAGPEATRQSVEAGYTAFPSLYGDAHARLFIYWTTDNYVSSGCYNQRCEAFVQMANTRTLIGGKFDKTSTLNGEQREFTLRWQLCPSTECGAWEGWWLRYEGGSTAEWVGFYPRALFSAVGLRDKADRVDLGGEVAFVPGSTHSTVDMGSGQLPSTGFGRAAYQTNLRLITTNHAWTSFDGGGELRPKKGCYEVGPLQTVPRSTVKAFYFGGAGYSEACK